MLYYYYYYYCDGCNTEEIKIGYNDANFDNISIVISSSRRLGLLYCLLKKLSKE